MRPISRRRFLGCAAGVAALAAFPRRAFSGILAPSGGEWLAGDLHAHTIYSHDVCGTPPTAPNCDSDGNGRPSPGYTWGWTPAEQIAIAESRNLDFLALTDHNDIRSIGDPDWRSERVVLIPGYEHSLSEGHAGCLGVDRTFREIDTSTDQGALALRDAVRAAGGIFILNHPFYGDGWGYSPAVRPDSIEVWNIGWPYRKPLFPGVDTSNNHESLGYWEWAFLATGKLPATGGSDNHWRSTVAVQGVGQPTTWVYAERTWGAVLDAIRAGRTTVSAEPPALGGARLFLTVEGGSTEFMVGETVPKTTGRVAVKARAVNAPGHLLQLFVDGIPQDPVPVAGPDFVHAASLDAAEHNRVRAELYLEERYWMSALTSPVYFG